MTDRPRIAVVLSYHDAYAWQAEIIEGIEDAIGDRADLLWHRLDTIGVSDEDELAARGRRALAWIEAAAPDAVILADDHAMQHVYEAGLAGGDLPVAVCGLNWPADRYDLPRPGLAGMIEITPVDQVIDLAADMIPGSIRGTVIGTGRRTDRIQSQAFDRVLRERGHVPHVATIETFEEWKQAFRRAQDDADFVYLLNSVGIRDWDQAEAERFVREHTRVVTATEYAWMVPLASFSVIKRGQEQGRWAALEALAAAGRPELPPRPLMLNREVTITIDDGLFAGIGLPVPDRLRLRASLGP